MATDARKPPRAQLEASLRDVEAQLRAVLGSALQAIIVLDRDCRLVAFNPISERWLGPVARGRPEVGMSMRDLIPREPPGAAEFFEANFARALTGETVHSERNLSDGQSDNWFEFLYTPWRDHDGQVVGVVFNALPINARKLAEQALRRSEAHFRSLIENIWDIITLLDLGGTILYESPSIERHLGWKHNELVGRNAFEMIAPEDRAAVAEAFGRAIAEPGIQRHVEFRFAHKDGSWRTLEAVGDAHRDEAGKVIGVVAASRDVTERRRTEEALRAAERQSLQADKLRALGQMASGIAHDLNQSLALIAGYSDLAHAQVDQSKPDLVKLRQMLATIAQAAMDGGESVKRLLNFARTEPDVPPEPVALGALLDEVARLTAPRWHDSSQAEGRVIRLKVVGDDNPLVQGYAAGLREALTNLIFNAVDALPRGGSIELAARREGARAVVTVVDDGVGMSAEVKARALEPFFTTKGERGSGLGLAQVFGIVERHGGALSLDSRPGFGTTVRIELPLSAAAGGAATTSSPPEPAPAPSGPRLRVLAVDDEIQLARMAAETLGSDGHAVSVAGGAEEALDLLEAQRFDLIVSDLAMGSGQSGWQLAAEVRRRWPDTRFILATGWAAEIDAETARVKSVDAVVGKPYRLADLRKAIRDLAPGTSRRA
jgi:PAS domain S-box-containing protein